MRVGTVVGGPDRDEDMALLEAMVQGDTLVGVLHNDAVVMTKLALRAGPSDQAKILGYLPQGAVVIVTGEGQRGFWPVSFGRRRGYALKAHLAYTPVQAVTTAAASIYAGPSVASNAVGKIPHNKAVQITGPLPKVAAGWPQVVPVSYQSRPGAQLINGYVAAKNLRTMDMHRVAGTEERMNTHTHDEEREREAPSLVAGIDGEAILDQRFHLARGPKPENEQGLDSQIRVLRKGTKWIACVVLMTAAGPITLAASADEKVIAGLLARAMMSGDSFQKGLAPGAMDVIKESAQRIAEQVAKEAVSAKMAGAMGARFAGTPGSDTASKNAAAKRLYTRLTQKDPTAWESVRALVEKGKRGEAKALEAWTYLLRAHHRSRASSGEQGTPAHWEAARRLYARLQAKDPAAWDALMTIVRCAEKGDARCLRAWRLLTKAHNDTRSSFGFGGKSALRLSSAQVSSLTSLARAAATSRPPLVRHPSSITSLARWARR